MVVAKEITKSLKQKLLGSFSSETGDTQGVYYFRKGSGEHAVWTVGDNYQAVLVHEALHFLGNHHTIDSSTGKMPRTPYIDNSAGTAYIMAPAHQQIGFNWKRSYMEDRKTDFRNIKNWLKLQSLEDYHCPAPLIVESEALNKEFTPEQQLFIKHGRQVDPRDLNLTAVPAKLGTALKIIKLAKVVFYTVALSIIVLGFLSSCCYTRE